MPEALLRSIATAPPAGSAVDQIETAKDILEGAEKAAEAAEQGQALFDQAWSAVQALPVQAHIVMMATLVIGVVLWLFGRKLIKPATGLLGIAIGCMIGLLVAPRFGVSELFGVPIILIGLGAGGLIGLTISLFILKTAVTVLSGGVFAVGGLLGGIVYIEATTPPPPEEEQPDPAALVEPEPTVGERGTPTPPGTSSLIDPSNTGEPEPAAPATEPASAEPKQPTRLYVDPRTGRRVSLRELTRGLNDGTIETTDAPDPPAEAPESAAPPSTPPAGVNSLVPAGQDQPESSADQPETDQTDQTDQPGSPDAEEGAQPADPNVNENDLIALRVRAVAEEAFIFIRDVWNSLDTANQAVVGGAAIMGMFIGVAFGIFLPKRSTSLVTAFFGSGTWLMSAAYLAEIAPLSFKPALEALFKHDAPIWLAIWVIAGLLGWGFQLAKPKKRKKSKKDD